MTLGISVEENLSWKFLLICGQLQNIMTTFYCASLLINCETLDNNFTCDNLLGSIHAPQISPAKIGFSQKNYS